MDDPRSPNVHEGERIAGYRLVRVLGEGGMGVVYLAEQTEPVRREVALKVLKPGMDSAQIVARFEAERQALAVMEHPGIARVFDAGETEAGRPFFVMERVDGVPITDYCDGERLGVRARVRLFAQVCRAVQHAHQKGVIHRDLKPSNVLVTVTDDAPLCKVIDFGIARAVEATAEDATRLTQLGVSPGTPAYMSPEQVAGGRDIDTRSDIYSLGVLLYELLAGALPFEIEAYGGWRLYAQHLVRDPPVLSARFAGLDPAEQARIAETRDADPAALRRRLRGDLDWVVMRALEKDRDRRYETANGFAADLGRFLANEPVTAGPPGRAYRAGKFVRRHRAGVAFAGVLAVLLVGFVVAMGVQAERVARARDLAVVRQGQAEDLIGFMVGDLRVKLAPVGRLDILDDVGQRALAYFAAVPEVELSDEELFRRAEAIRQLGEVRLEQGNLEAASEAFGEALALMRRLAARDSRNADWQAALGAAHFWVGDLLRRQGDLDSARREYGASHDIAEALVRRDPMNLLWRRELAMASGNVGAVAYMEQDLPAARRAWEQRLETQRVLSAQDPTDTELQLELSNAHNQLGLALRDAGALDAALEQFRADVALKRGMVAQDPDHVVHRGLLAVSTSFLARLERALGHPDSALAHHLEELKVNQDLASHDPENAVWQRRRVISHARVGELLLESGNLEDAAYHIDHAVSLAASLAAAHPAQRVFRIGLTFRRREQAELALASGDVPGALAATALALTTIDSVLAQSPEDRSALEAAGVAYLSRGRAWAAAGGPDSAMVAWTRSAELLEPLANASQSWPVLEAYARTLLLGGRMAEGEQVAERLREMGFREPSFESFLVAQRGQSARGGR